MIKRLKEMEMHYKQLETSNKAKVLKLIDNLDRAIEDILLEQEYDYKSDFIREYRKNYSLRDIKKSDRKNRLVVINSLDDGHIREVHKDDKVRAAASEVKFALNQRLAHTKDELWRNQ
jgi:uncharacterized lipoprotein YehR (DUF1307 family)